MKTVRSNIFETNSSSTHSVVLRPIDPTIVDAVKKGRCTLGEFPFCKEKKMLVLDKDPRFEFGVYQTFYKKLNYVVCLLLYRHSNELYPDNKDYWDDSSFNLSNANKILDRHYKEFCNQIAEYVSKRYNIDCKKIGYLSSLGKGGRTGNFNFDHEVLSDTSEDDLHLGVDLFKVITTEGLAIYYDFA